MRKILSLFFVALLLSSSLYAKAILVDKEGKAWLEHKTGAAEINVTGVWDNKEWGDVTLDQPQGKREVTGDGDLWKINGVVSGKKAFLLFSRKGEVEYSAVLHLEQEDMLAGAYSDYLIAADKDGDKKISLKRKSTKVTQPAVGSEKETARVIIYIKKSQGLPGVYLDGRQIVWMDKGYISFRLDPGQHEMYIKGAGWSGWGPYNEPIKLDARAGETYYYEAGRWGAWIKYWTIKAKTAEITMKDIKNKVPMNAKFVVMDSLVSLEPIQQKR